MFSEDTKDPACEKITGGLVLPEDLTTLRCNSEFTTKIDDFDFITRGTDVYLRCSLGKTVLL